MIDLNLPEPPPEKQFCANCGRHKGGLKGRLIHWPDEQATSAIYNGVESFSLWVYTCRWCRGGETRRAKHVALEEGK